MGNLRVLVRLLLLVGAWLLQRMVEGRVLTVDFDAHRRILSWAYESGRLCFRERNFLLENLSNAEWAATQCQGKQRFDTLSMAQAIASKSSFRHDCGMLAYFCIHCGGHHVGKKKPQVFRRAA